MTWLTPAIALAAAAALIPVLVALYFLKLKRKDVEVSTTLLWKKSIQDMQANAPFQRLRRNILLLLQLLLLAAGLLALAQPELQGRRGAARRMVILIDRSASMSTRDGARGESRLEAAKRQAIALIDDMREGGALGGGLRDEAMVIAFDADAQALQPFTSDKRALRRAVESIQPTDAPTRIREALQLAGAATRLSGDSLEDSPARGAQAGAILHIWSDGRISDVDRVTAPAGAAVVWERVGQPIARNFGITNLRVSRAIDNPDRISVFVAVQAVGASDDAVDVELALDGAPIAVERAALSRAPSEERAGEGAAAAGGALPATGGVVFHLERAQGALLSARIAAADDLDADNLARLALPPARRLRVALVAEGGLFVRTALEGMNLSRLVMMTSAEAQRLARDADGWAQFDVVVLDASAPPTGADGAIAPGRYLALGVIPEIGGVTRIPANDSDETTLPLDWDRRSAMTRDAGFESLVIGRTLGLDAGERAETLMQTERGPGLIRARDAGVEALITAFAPVDSNWPFEPGFIVFLGEALRDLAGGSDGATASLAPGQAIAERLPSDAQRVRLTPLIEGAAAGAIALVPDADARVMYGPVRRAGLYTLRWRGSPGPADFVEGGDAVRPVVVNLLDGAESDVRPAPSLDLPATSVVAHAATAADESGRRSLWPWLLLLAIGALSLEWWVYNRRVAI